MASALSAFSYSRTLTLNTTSSGANVTAADQADFPICVVVNSSSWADATERGHFFDASNTNGKRVQFFDADGTTNLAYEVESYDGSGQTAIYWVKKPTVTKNSSTDHIHVGYGNDPNSADQNSTSVWNSGYVLVQHLGGNQWGSSPEAKDSSASGNNGTNAGSTDAAGTVGRGRSFDGLNDGISLATNIAIPANLTLFAAAKIGAWVAQQPIFGAGTSNLSYYWSIGCANATNKYGLFYKYDGTNQRGWKSSGNIDTSAAHILSWSQTGTNAPTLMIDGAIETLAADVTSGASAAKPTGATTTTIGNLGAYAYPLTGVIDELRLSNVARSAEYQLLEYWSVKVNSAWNGDKWLTWGMETGAVPNATVTITPSAMTAGGVAAAMTGNVMNASVTATGEAMTANGASASMLGYTGSPAIEYDLSLLTADNVTVTVAPSALTLGGGTATMDNGAVSATVTASVGTMTIGTGAATITGYTGSPAIEYDLVLLTGHATVTASAGSMGLGGNAVEVSNWTRIATTAANATSYVDHCPPGTYEYRVAPETGGVAGTWLQSEPVTRAPYYSTPGRVTLGTTSANITGTTTASATVTATAGAMTAGGNAATVTGTQVVVTAPGNVTLGGSSVTVTASTNATVSAYTATMTLTGQPATMTGITTGDATVTATTGDMALAGTEATATGSANVTATPDSFTLGGAIVAVSGEGNVTVITDAGAMTLRGVSVSTSTPTTVTVSAGELGMVGRTIEVIADSLVVTSAGVMTLSGTALFKPPATHAHLHSTTDTHASLTETGDTHATLTTEAVRVTVGGE